MDYKLRVLGSVSPYSKNGSNCPGYLFDLSNEKVLLDCGSGITSRMNMPEDLENLTIVISHFHKDHYSDLFSLAYASFCYHRMGKLNNKIKVYLPEVFSGELGYDDYLMIKNLNEQYFEIFTYNENSKISLNNVNIDFFKTNHSITNYSSRMYCDDFKIVYTGDMGFSNIDNYVKFCFNADLLISESTFLVKDNMNSKDHLRTVDAAYIANFSNTNMLMLTHFWPEHNKLDYVYEAKKLFNNTIAADENVVININDLLNDNNKKNSR